MTTLCEKLDKYIDETFSWPDADIYHYTNKEDGNKIIRSGFFRLTSHHDLNKKGNNGELIVGPELTRKYLKKTNRVSHEYTFNKMIENGITLHIGSFCKEKNNSHAIKKYGSACLEFKTNYLKELSNSKNYRALVGSVKYNTKEQNEIISTMFDLYEEQTDEDPKTRYSSLLKSLLTIFPLLKHEKHHRDNECRIVTVYGKEKNNPEKIIGTKRDQIKFSSKDVTLLT